MSNQYIEQDSKSNSYLDKLTDKKILKLELFRPIFNISRSIY